MPIDNYCFAPMLGYEYVKQSDKNKMLAPKEPDASFVREALEGFASGRFQSPIEVARFLGRFPSIPRDKHGEVRLQTAIDMLKRPLYAGYITVPKWGIHLHPGKHEPLISFATWQKIQERLGGVSTAPARKDLNRDFPLRGFVCCASCGNPMTAGWSKGRNALYPYYNCQKPGCASRKKSIKKVEIEGEFRALLKALTPCPEAFKVLRAMMADLWDNELERSREGAARGKAEIAAIEQQISKLVSRIVGTDNQRVAAAYEAEIRKLDQKKLGFMENASQTPDPVAKFDELYRTACAFLANPCKLWDSGVFELQRLTLRLAFPRRLSYCPNQGYRTAGIAEPLRLLGASATPKSGLVRAGGLEPPLPYEKQIFVPLRLSPPSGDNALGSWSGLSLHRSR